MNACKCFLNDQLLPVRAGCEAIWCKDVNSHTAIRDEALSRIADLKAQVARLEAELAEVKGENIATLLNMAQVVGERDTAQAANAAKDAALRDGITKFDPGPHESIHYGKAIHSRTCQAVDGHLCDCRVGQWLVAARAALSQKGEQK